MKKIAVTGASGFIGQAVVRRLKDADLTILDRNKHNLLDSESLKDFVKDQDAIIHLAGVNRGANSELVQTNVLGTLSLLETITKYSPNARVIFASTFQVYLPQSLYGLSKKFAEDLLRLYGINHKIQSTILRLSNVYGPDGKPFYNSVIATFAHLIKNGKSLNVNGDGSQERDYVHVDDVAKSFVKAAIYNQKEPTEVIDICSGRSTSLKRIIESIGEIYDKKIEVVYNNVAKEKLLPTKDKNFQKAKELLDWEPKISLKEGLTEVMK